jgi:hypothetical protein
VKVPVYHGYAGMKEDNISFLMATAVPAVKPFYKINLDGDLGTIYKRD